MPGTRMRRPSVAPGDFPLTDFLAKMNEAGEAGLPDGTRCPFCGTDLAEFGVWLRREGASVDGVDARSLAAYAAELGIENRVHGSPMSFWYEHMPEGMYLRSACDWHLDAAGVERVVRM